MADEPVTVGEGFAAGVAAAVEAAGPLLPLRDAEQLELIRDGTTGVVDRNRVARAERQQGRPPGATNKRTAAVRDYLLSRYAHPLEVLAQMISRPLDALVAELGCKPIEAMALVKSAAAELAPYLESKMPVSIDVSTRRDVVLIMANADRIEQLGETIERDGIEGIDWAKATLGQVIEGQVISQDAPRATDEA